MLTSIAGKSTIVTGGSKGIGKGIAKVFAAQGAKVMIAARGEEAGAAAVAEIEAAGGTAMFHATDVADWDSVAGMVAATAPVTELTFERMRKLFDLNVIGAILVAKEAVTRMQAQGDGGAIVNISSVAARLGSGNQYVDYAASKAAIDTFTKGLSDEVAAQNIRVNAICPGLIETPLHEKGGEPGRAQRLAHMVPMKREGSAKEVAEAVLYLLSDEASYIVGTTLDVSGGR